MTQEALLVAAAALFLSLWGGTMLIGAWRGPDRLPRWCSLLARRQTGITLWLGVPLTAGLLLVPQVLLIRYAFSPIRHFDAVALAILFGEPLLPWAWTWYLLSRTANWSR
jgi:hypothetical protein